MSPTLLWTMWGWRDTQLNSGFEQQRTVRKGMPHVVSVQLKFKGTRHPLSTFFSLTEYFHEVII